MDHIKIGLRDRDIRQGLKQKVLPRYVKAHDSIVIDEFILRHGEARIDVAVINHQMHGFEIKSDQDSLARLPFQEKVYSAIFDRVTLVVGQRHLGHALQIVPDWWGVKVVSVGARGGVNFEAIRRPLNNFEFDSLAIVSLLWREEARNLLSEFDSITKWRSKSRSVLYARLVEVVEPSILRARVRKQLKARSNWRVDAALELDGD